MTKSLSPQSSYNEKPVVFDVEGHSLVGIYHQSISSEAKNAVIIVVGGPQTRVGSHRQFVLLAREYAKKGVDVFRFDYSGAGDSEGEIKSFSALSDDISGAVQALLSQNKQLKSISLWGLCDAASAILIYLANNNDPRITQLTLANPWVRQVATEAQTYLRSYYIKRLFQWSFWQKMLKGKLKVSHSITDIKHFKQQSKQIECEHNFVDEMLNNAKAFQGDIHFILSGNDLTANEFKLLTRSKKEWKELMLKENVTVSTVELADHTFSRTDWHKQMVNFSLKQVL